MNKKAIAGTVDFETLLGSQLSFVHKLVGLDKCIQPRDSVYFFFPRKLQNLPAPGTTLDSRYVILKDSIMVYATNSV